MGPGGPLRDNCYLRAEVGLANGENELFVEAMTKPLNAVGLRTRAAWSEDVDLARPARPALYRFTGR